MMEYDRYLRAQLSSSYVKKGINDQLLQFKYWNIRDDLLLSSYFDSKEQYYHFLVRINKEQISM